MELSKEEQKLILDSRSRAKKIKKKQSIPGVGTAIGYFKLKTKGYKEIELGIFILEDGVENG